MSKDNDLLPHISLINEFFDYLNNNINYVILRNYQKLPYDYGNDIDILIDERDLDKAINALKYFVNINKYDYKICKIINRYHYKGVYININENILLIDFFTDIVKRWFKYADKTIILEKRQKFNNFYIPLLEYEVGIIVFKELLTYKKVRKKYKNYLNEKLKYLNKDIFFDMFSKYIQEESIENVWNCMIANSIYTDPLNVQIKFFNKFNIVEFFKWGKKRLLSLPKGNLKKC